MAKRFIIGLLISFSAMTFVVGQSLPDQLKQQLVGKQTLAEIMQVVDSFYLNFPEVQGRYEDDLEQWKRWEWYMSRRLGPNGEFVHIPKLNMDALNQLDGRNRSRWMNPTTGSWTSLGMNKSSYSADTINGGNNTYANGTGRIDRIAFHPTDANTIYIGSPNGGVWKTTDGGLQWNCLTDSLPTLGVSGIVVDYSNPDKLYILTGTGDDNVSSYSIALGISAPSMGVLKSIDAGVTWSFTDTLTFGGITQYFGYDLVQSPTNASVLLAATSLGIFRTSDSGASWAKVKSGTFYDLLFKPGSGTIVYAATDDSLYYSTNGGVNWIYSTLNIAPSIPALRIALAASPQQPSRVYAFFGNSGVAGQFSGVYRSENSGISYTRQATTPNVLDGSLNGSGAGSQAGYDLCIAVDPTNADKLMIGGVILFQSIDSAASFTGYAGWYENQGGITYSHADHHALAYNPLNNKLYNCNDGGIWVSDVNNMMKNISNGLVISQFYHLAQYPRASYIMSGGLQDNGIKYRPKGTKDFIHMYGADGFSTSFAPKDSNTFYVSINSGLDRMNFSDGSIVGITPPGDGKFFKEVLAHPTINDLVFCGSTSIYRSTDKGANWTNVGGNGIWGMAISSVVPARMYSIGASSFWPIGAPLTAWTSADTGKTWTILSGNPGFPTTANTITDVAADPQSAGTVYITVGGFTAGSKIFRSTDFGANWSNYSANLPNVVVNSVVATQDAVFVGTDISVFYRSTAGSTWVNIGENLPHVPVIDMLVDENIGTLTAATFGRGVWQRNYCIDDIDLTYPLAGKLEYKCNDQLTSSSLITGTMNDTISFKAGGKIKLLPGFKAGVGTYFTTKKEACDNGNIPMIMPSPTNVSPSTAKIEKGRRKKVE